MTMKNNNNTNKSSNSFVFGLTLVATLGGLLFGYDTAVISGAVGSLQAFFIDSLNIENGEAQAVVLEYRITVYAAIYVVLLSVGGLLIKLLGRGKGILFTVLAGIVVTYIIKWNFSGEPVLDSNTANSLKGFTTSSALIGCIIGGSLAGTISRMFGRKKGLILSAVLFSISAIGSAAPEYMNLFGVQTLTSFIIYRIVGGIGVGIASMISPMYIAEIAPPKIRGKLVSWNQFAIIFGMLVIYFVNYFIAKSGDQAWLDGIGWRWMFASETIPAALFLVLLIFVPETPRFMVMKNQDDKALSVLQKLNGAEKSAGILGKSRNRSK
jgi:SP family xylose:H+ symportor-like MFS transporter